MVRTYIGNLESKKAKALEQFEIEYFDDEIINWTVALDNYRELLGVK